MTVMACEGCTRTGFRAVPELYAAVLVVLVVGSYFLLRWAMRSDRVGKALAALAVVLVLGSTVSLGVGLWRGLQVGLPGGGTEICGTTLGASQQTFTANGSASDSDPCRPIARERVEHARNLALGTFSISALATLTAVGYLARNRRQTRLPASTPSAA
jgi:hypothetical protein